MNQVLIKDRSRSSGFTLIELMITVVVVAVLASIAIPSYTQYVVKSRRKAAESFMLTVSNAEEKYLLDARAYAYDTTLYDGTSLSKLSLLVPAEVSPYYSIGVAATAGVTLGYTITARPAGTQVSGDSRYGKCGNLTLDQTGSRGVSGTGTASSCW